MSRPDAEDGAPLAISVAGLELVIDDDFIEAVAKRVVERSVHRLTAEPFLTAQQAADHLACPLSRIRSLTSARRIPVHRDGSRVLYRASELDRWVEAGGGKRP